ncbi:MAG: hypothetical protein WB441_11540 [Nocardioidaceae bacterium]
MRSRTAALVVTTLVVALVAGIVAAASPPKYVSTTSLLVGPVTSDLNTLRASESLTSTYSQLLLRPAALAEVGGFVSMSPKEVEAASDVKFNTETRIVTLTVTTGSATQSPRIASALTARLTRLVGTIDPTSPGALQILTEQPQTVTTVSRSVTRYALLAAVGWLLLAAAVVAAFAARPTGAAGRESEPGARRARFRTSVPDAPASANGEAGEPPVASRHDGPREGTAARTPAARPGSTPG